jgi:hypothetical protein
MLTGLQTAQLGLIRLLEAWRGQFSPREFSVLLDLLARWIESASGGTREGMGTGVGR